MTLLERADRENSQDQKGKERQGAKAGRGQIFRQEERGEVLGLQLDQGIDLKMGVKVEVGSFK